MAAHNFNDAHGDCLPNPAEPINPAFSATAANPWNQATGPFFQLLPYLEAPSLYSSIRAINGQAAYDAIMPTPQGRASVVKVLVSPADPSSDTSLVNISGSPTPINNGLWGLTSYAYNPLVFRTVPVGIGRSFPDGTRGTLLFSEKYQICGSGPGLATIENYWFGSYVGNSTLDWAPRFAGRRPADGDGPVRRGRFPGVQPGGRPGGVQPGGPKRAAFRRNSRRNGRRRSPVSDGRWGNQPFVQCGGAEYDQPAAGAVVPLRGYIWSALLTPDAGEVYTLD